MGTPPCPRCGPGVCRCKWPPPLLILRGLLALGLGVVGCTGCHGPSPSPPAPSTPAAVVYGELVEAECLDPSDGGLDFVTAAHAEPLRPAWLDCLFDGGAVTTCGVPCE